MIIPWLRGIFSIRTAPITWIVFFVNTGVFIFFNLQFADVNQKYDEFLRDQSLIQVQGSTFAQFINRHPAAYPVMFTSIAQRAVKGHSGAILALSGFALRDQKFLNEGIYFLANGDELAIDQWRIKFKKFLHLKKDHPSHLWGLSLDNSSFWHLISYQFVHGSLIHLIVNMYFMLIFAFFLETLIGGWAVADVYLVTGACGALAFYFVSGLSMAPLIGASGSVNGLIGAFFVLSWKERQRFLFFLVPKLGYWGFVKLPAWCFVLLWLVSDLAGLFASVSELGGVAYSAHLGGLLSGILMGGVLFFFAGRKSAAQSIL